MGTLGVKILIANYEVLASLEPRLYARSVVRMAASR